MEKSLYFPVWDAVGLEYLSYKRLYRNLIVLELTLKRNSQEILMERGWKNGTPLAISNPESIRL
jgi:hypothetical protein